MSYRPYYRTPVEKVTDPTIPNRIDVLLANQNINDWEKNFLTSIKESYNKYQALTRGQHDAFLNVEKKHDATAIAARDEWRKTWDAEKKAVWDMMIDYYSKTPYYKGAVDKVKVNPNYIPSEKEYAAVCLNKYAVKMQENRKIPAKYKEGQLAIFKYLGNYYLSTIVEVGQVNTWVKGSREYKINIFGDMSVRQVDEKEILFYRESMLSKVSKWGDPPF